MSENSSPLSTPEGFHREIVDVVAAQVDRDRRADSLASDVQLHPEGGAAFEAEMADRMVVQPRSAAPPSGVRPVTTTTAAVTGSRSRGRGAGGFSLVIILGLILALAGYIAFFDDDGSDSDGEAAALAPANERGYDIPEPTRRSTGPINFFNVAIEGFDELLAGRIRPAVEGSTFSSVKGSLQSRLGRPITFDGARGRLIGGDLTTVRTLQVPRFFYSGGETVLLVAEVPWTDLAEENGVYVAPDILTQLEAGTPVFSPGPSNGTMAIFRRAESAIVAVSDRSEPDLRAILGLN